MIVARRGLWRNKDKHAAERKPEREIQIWQPFRFVGSSGRLHFTTSCPWLTRSFFAWLRASPLTSCPSDTKYSRVDPPKSVSILWAQAVHRNGGAATLLIKDALYLVRATPRPLAMDATCSLAGIWAQADLVWRVGTWKLGW